LLENMGPVMTVRVPLPVDMRRQLV
jgi:hypothetical protein